MKDKVRAIVFDLDDTLYRERDFVSGGFAAVADWMKSRMAAPDDVAERMQRIAETGGQGRVFNRLLDELGVGEAEDWVPAMIEVYRRHRPDIRLFPDAERALGRCGNLAATGLISDGYFDVQSRKVEALGLANRIQHVILTDQWGREFWKPHPRAFREFEDLARCPPTACVYVADNPGKDFVAPRGLGWECIRICRPDGVYRHAAPAPSGEPHRVIASLDELEL